MRFGSPGAQAYDFERYGAIETFLMGAVNYTLTTSADFLQQFVIAKVSQHSWRSRGATDARRPRMITYVFIFVAEQTKAVFQKTSRANSLPRVVRNLCAALATNAIGSLHFDGSTIVTVAILPGCA